MKEKERAKLRIRAAVLFWGCAFVASILLFRLFSFQVREGAGLAALAGQEQRATFKVDGRRGDIVDRFGAPFATNIASKAISVRPADVGDAGAEAKQMSGVLGI